ncbi:hypothetical protein C2G38_2048464 [Gigaspora rosea]|uniref:Uncharacterized protein n=1 Tax=Gigaspora rosea TaxID=44941 RepID=A0A397U2E0_9GLOM|nr:hypothetical protein C2G38_2048464 [Gigaspora rosea]
MSVANNDNMYSLLEVIKHTIDSVEMQIDDDTNEYKRIKLSSVEVTPLPATTNTLLEEAVAGTKSGETPLTPTSLMMISSQMTIKTNKLKNKATSLTGIKFSPNNPYIDIIHENSHAEHTHIAGLEIDDLQILEAARKVDDQHIATNIDSMMVTGDTSKEIDKIETELIGTIEKKRY